MRANIFAGFRRISRRLNGNNKDMGKNTVKIELFVQRLTLSFKSYSTV